MNSVTHIHNNVSLRFDMSMTSQAESYRRSSSPRTNGGEYTEQGIPEASDDCDDRHGKPHGNGHGNQINRRQGYAINQNLVHGEPNGINHVPNDENQIQGLTNSGADTMGQILRLSGEPQGHSSSTGIPIMVDPTVVDNISICSNTHRRKRPKLSDACNSLTYQEQIEQYPIAEKKPEIEYKKCMHVPDSPPVRDEMSRDEKFKTQIQWERDEDLSICEDKIISHFQGQELPKMKYRQISDFGDCWRQLNRERRRLNMLELPNPLHKDNNRVIRRIEPLVQLTYPEIASNMSIQDVAIEEAKYRDLVMAAQIEIDTIGFISTGVTPQMNANEKIRYEKYLKIVNEQRVYNEGYELQLDKTYAEHIRIEHPEYEIQPFEETWRQGREIIQAETNDNDSESVNNNHSDISVEASIQANNNHSPSESDNDTSVSSSSLSQEAEVPEISQENVIDLIDNGSDIMSIQSIHTNTVSTTSNQGSTTMLPKEKQLSEFIDKLLELTLCPIKFTTFKKPVITMEGNLFEEDDLYKWLNENSQTCPLTRSFLHADNVRPCHTMKRLVNLMNNHDISPNFFKEMLTEMNENGKRKVTETLVEAPPKETIKPVTQLTSSQLRKARRKKENRKIKKKLNKKMSQHSANLRHHGYFRNSNLKCNMPSRPSYSMLHSFSEGFSIVLYSRSHKVDISPNIALHKDCAVRLVLGPEMVVIWHEGLYHSGAKSRNTPEAQTDRRFFAYLWPFVKANSRNRQAGSCDGVARASGDEVFRTNINECTCKYLYEEIDSNHPCIYCKDEEILMDLRGIQPTSYSPCDRIIGDLKTFGWEVFRTPRVSAEMEEDIRQISKLGSGWDGRWFAVDVNGPNRMMKYKPSSKLPTEWDTGLPAKFKKNITKQLLEKVLNNREENLIYIIGKYNILKNAGYIQYDQMPHTDYPPRLMM